jgi:MFS family permease
VSRLGPLREREFRLLFAGRTISMVGSAMAPIALAFAVLDLTHSTTDLGLVLAARTVPTVGFILFGGVIADRLPRHRVMVASNLTSSAGQAITAALLITGHAQLWELGALAAVNGSSAAFFMPASSGILPQIVAAPLRQQANAILGLARNGTSIVGAALGGLLVAAAGPGWAIGIDAMSYGLAAVFLAALNLPPGLRIEGSTMFKELHDGWRDFWSRTWLWAIVLQFAIVNAVGAGATNVLGPSVAEAHYGGAGAFGAILAATSVGLVLTGTVMLRWRPHRLLRTATFGVFPMALPLIAFAGPAPLVVVILAGFVAGAGIEVFGVLWDTAMQQEIPGEKLSRLSAYDMLGSLVLIPIALATAGPVAQVVGQRRTFIGAAVLIVVMTGLVLLSRDVRDLERKTA